MQLASNTAFDGRNPFDLIVTALMYCASSLLAHLHHRLTFLHEYLVRISCKHIIILYVYFHQWKLVFLLTWTNLTVLLMKLESIKRKPVDTYIHLIGISIFIRYFPSDKNRFLLLRKSSHLLLYLYLFWRVLVLRDKVLFWFKIIGNQIGDI